VRTFDPIFMWVESTGNGKSKFVQVGAIERTSSPDSKSNAITDTAWARAEFFSNAPRLSARHTLTFYETPQTMDFVLKTMLPRETRDEIAKITTKAYLKHHQEIFGKLRPILEAGLQDAASVIQEEFQLSITRHEQDLSRLGVKYQRELVEAKIIPLINKEIWPIVQAEAEPLVKDVGEEIWSKASVWRFGWAFIYDATPLPRRNLAKKEFNRFVQEYALPILSAHIKDFIKLQQKILAKISRSQKVQNVVMDSFKTASRDPELQKVVVSILQDVFVNNERLQTVVNDYWTSEKTQEALRIADDRLEPAVTQIGELLFGNPKQRVTPEFARVLRANVLKKDHRWFLLEKHDTKKDSFNGTVMVVSLGGETDLNPFDYSIPGTEN